MSSSSSSLNVTSQKNSQARRKYWVCVVTPERPMKQQAKHWVELQAFVRKKDYSLINPNRLSEVRPKDTLYIYCHSGYIGNQSLPYMISDFNDLSSKDKPYTPNEFLKFLQACKLTNEIEIVKIASCNSAEFAKLVANEARQQNIYPSMCISGYIGQLVLCQGKNGGKLAGLNEPYVTQDNKGHRTTFKVSTMPLQNIPSTSSQVVPVTQNRNTIIRSSQPSILSIASSSSANPSTPASDPVASSDSSSASPNETSTSHKL